MGRDQIWSSGGSDVFAVTFSKMFALDAFDLNFQGLNADFCLNQASRKIPHHHKYFVSYSGCIIWAAKVGTLTNVSHKKT